MPGRHLKFESKQKALLPFEIFIIRVFRFFVYAMAMIIISVGIGTTGYKFLGNMTWVDGFYNACMILTGMGPVSQLTTNAAKIFSSFYALFSGIAFLTTVAVLFAPIVHRFLHKLHIDEDETGQG